MLGCVRLLWCLIFKTSKENNGIGRWYTPFFRFGMKLWEGATEKAFPGHPEQSGGRPADTQQLHFRDK